MKFKHIIFFILVLVGNTVFISAQDPEKTYVLQESLNGILTYDYKARESITLKDGFSYTPSSSSNSFTAQIDESVICPSEYSTVQNTPGQTGYPLSREDTPGPVGSIAGSFNVSPGGAATYSIPIDIPSGIAGMEPDLSVVYNSQSGNGSMGAGWSLGGISSISRTGKSLYFDDEISGILFNNEDDRLSLNGQRLISITDNKFGLDADDFETESKSFLSIEKLGTFPDYWFRVTTRDGKVMEYGKEDNAKYESNSNILAWMINSVVDEYGNYIKYYYNNDSENGQITIQRIEYGGNETVGINPVNEIIFGYNERDDVWKGKIRLTDVTQDLLLAQITIKNNGDNLAIYKFNYTIQDGVSCLYEIIQEDGTGNELNSTMCTWSKAEFDNTYSTCSFSVQTGDSYTQGDYNGDGFSDILTLNSSSCYLNKGTVNGITVKGQKQNLIRSNFHDEGMIILYGCGNTQYLPTDIDDLSDVVKVISGDFDGDGEMELLEFVKNYDLSGSSITTICEYITTLSSSNSFNIDVLETLLSATENYSVYLLGFNNGILSIEKEFTTTEYPSAATIDFNQDGKTDYVIDDKIYTLNLEGDGSIEEIGTSTKTDYFGKVYWGDINADGRLDFVTRDGTAFGWSDLSNDYTTLSYSGTSTAIGVVDTDGDGWSELLLIGPDEYVEETVYDPETGLPVTQTIHLGRELYTQNYNLNKVKSFGYFLTNTPTHSAVLDINGDGRADIALFQNSTLQKIYYSTGTLDFEEMTIDKTVGYNVFPGDYNGDGIYEFCCIGYTGYKFATGQPGYVVNGIIDGLNRVTKISYAPLTNDEVYTKTSPGTHPLININAAMYVVKDVTTGDGLGGESITEYRYQDAKVHTQGKGFLGFAKVTTENSVTGSTVSNYSVNTDFYFMQLSSTETFAADETPLSKTTYSYTTVGDPEIDKRYFNYASTILQEDLLKGNKSQQTIAYTGDNLTSEIVKINTNESEVDKIYSGHNNEGSPATVITTYKRNGAANISRTETYTYTSNGDVETTLSKGLKTKYFYDSFGNVYKIIAGFESDEARETEYEYTADGRFAEKKIDPLDREITMKYDAWGNITESEDPNGLIVKNVYDTWGRLTQTTGPDGRTFYKNTYWAGGEDNPSFGNPSYYTKVTDEDGDFNGAEYYDALGRLIRKVSVPYQGKKVYADVYYNNKGQVIQEDASVATSTKTTIYEYYDNGLLEKETFPNGEYFTYDYTNNDVVKTYSESSSEVYSKTYDGSGLVISATDPGGTITYSYFADGQVSTITAPGGTTSITYDATTGLQKTLTDPDAGTMQYNEYNVFGELLKQTDPRQKQTTLTYDALGRINTKSLTGEDAITYIYDENNKLGTLTRIQRNNINEFSYEYDDLMRITKETRSDGTESFAYEYTYDTDGNVKTMKYPSGIILTYSYNSFGNLEEIKKGTTSIWKQEGSVNNLGQLTGATFGNNKEISYGYDAMDRLNSITVTDNINFSYTYNNKNQLTNRTENYRVDGQWKGINESFTYDDLNRLKTASGGESLTMTYKGSPNDRIEEKTDIGEYAYFSDSNHKLERINNAVVTLPTHSINYTASGKTESITENDVNKVLTITYGVDDQRFKTVYTNNSVMQYTRYFFDAYEKEELSDGTEKELNYIYAYGKLVAIYEGNSTSGDMHYVYTDYLGSIRCITDATGTIEEKLSFDAWGNRRDYDTGEKLTSVPTGMLTARGFTGHEHLDNFGLINMNGRVYDPYLGIFLSPDNYVQMPYSTQNYNRYSYVLNNPLMFTDPTGEFFDIAFFILGGALLKGIWNGQGYNGEWNWKKARRGFFEGAAMASALIGGATSGCLLQFASGVFNAGGIMKNGANALDYASLGLYSFNSIIGNLNIPNANLKSTGKIPLATKFFHKTKLGRAIYDNKDLLSSIGENTYSGLSLLNSGTKSVAGLRRIFGNLGGAANGGGKIDLSKSKNPYEDVINFMTSAYSEWNKHEKGTYIGTKLSDHFYMKGPANAKWNWALPSEGKGMMTFGNSEMQIIMTFDPYQSFNHFDTRGHNGKNGKVQMWDLYIAAPDGQRGGNSYTNEMILIRLHGEGRKNDFMELLNRIYGN